MKKQIKIGHAPKTVTLENGGFLHFWYANNKGRGRSNCTIIKSTLPRAGVSSQQTDVIAMVRTSAWAGNVNFSKEIRQQLGVE
jgi:O-glycosyl hydrolase